MASFATVAGQTYSVVASSGFATTAKTSMPLVTDSDISSQTPTATSAGAQPPATVTVTPTPTSTPSPSIGSLPLSTGLAAIITPIAFIIILIPILYILWVRRRSKKLGHRVRSARPPSEKSAHETRSQQTRLLRHSPQNSTFLPSPVNDSERIKSGSLGVFELRRSLEDHGRMDSIGVFHQNPHNPNRMSPPPERGPSPTLPSPKAPAFNRPPSEAWPLPASGAKLPSPVATTNAYQNRDKAWPKPLPPIVPSHTPSSNSGLSSPPYQHPSVVNTRNQNPDILSYASSDVLVAPGASFRPPSSNYDLTPSSTTFPENARAPAQQAQRADHTTSLARTRDSDLVSELSYHEPSDRDRRRDTDAISVVSAMTDKRRRSERDADAVSLISALSPEEPRIPMEHYPL